MDFSTKYILAVLKKELQTSSLYREQNVEERLLDTRLSLGPELNSMSPVSRP